MTPKLLPLIVTPIVVVPDDVGFATIVDDDVVVAIGVGDVVVVMIMVRRICAWLS